MVLRLPPIRDLHLDDDVRQPAHPASSQGPVMRDERLQKILNHCQALCAFADHYANVPPPPNPPEVAEMVERAVEVIAILREYKQATCPPSAPPRAPKRPWEDTTDDVATPRPAPSPPADRVPSPVSSPPSPTIVVPPAQESQMTVFDGQPERHSNMDDKAKAVAFRDMEDIRARRGNGQPNGGKTKYKKRSRANPPGSCHSCEISDTPEWRRGPDGQRTLCNACGLHYAKLVRKRDRIISALPAGGDPPPPIDIAFLRKSARMAAENSALARSSAGRRRGGVDKDKAKAVGSPSSASSKPPSTSSDNGRRWDRRDKEAESVPQYTHASSSSYSAPPATSPTRQPALMPTTLPPPPQTRYTAPGPPPMNYFQPYVQSGPAPQSSYQVGPSPQGSSWGYDHAHPHHPPGHPPSQWGGDRYMPPHPR